jgi:hypothetical protein
MQPSRDIPFDEHFTAQELAAMRKLSRQTVRRIVEKEPGAGPLSFFGFAEAFLGVSSMEGQCHAKSDF